MEMTSAPPRNSLAAARRPTASIELSLARWLRTQRQMEESLCHYQLFVLRYLLGDFEDELSQDRLWERQLSDAKSFVDTYGRLPSPRSPHQPERTLARWVSHNRTRLASGSMQYMRVGEFTHLIARAETLTRRDANDKN
jgi:hypothetical protein